MKKNLKIWIVWMAATAAAFATGAAVNAAAINFGGGVYVNLCGSGTAASYYSCDPGCSIQTGSCQSQNEGVVKWICSGKWGQCLESESGWSNFEDVDSPGCSKTIQISLFDKKCRRQDNSWDESCKMLGYMVWYSGDCRTSTSPTVTPRLTPTPSAGPTRTPTPTTAPKPTTTPASKISSPVPTLIPGVANVCGNYCTKGEDCGAGFACQDGVCRNPSCPGDESCFCGDVAGAVTDKNPKTGWEEWVLLAGALILGPAGWKLKRMAKA
ncbi:hypothetical protein A2379_00335 [Candidatus Amesbacteria bacterium RIFOXYB1_FULL_47_13]|nr:MAG: hypothetical protein A2379_00335 [Candidatus Amesbacteria bacterium RIFOXYB1_FULL_47_13]HBC72199.1 hypothetical protein [Candidatus Amesbacteria bacterium]